MSRAPKRRKGAPTWTSGGQSTPAPSHTTSITQVRVTDSGGLGYTTRHQKRARSPSPPPGESLQKDSYTHNGDGAQLDEEPPSFVHYIKPKRKAPVKTLAVRMGSWLEFRTAFLEALLRHEAIRTPDLEPCQFCAGPSPPLASFACEDCHGHHMMCQQCLVDTHRRLPLHIVKEWTDSCFERRSLHALGLRVQLGHLEGDTCHFPKAGPAKFLVFDAGGYHHVAVNFCDCTSHPHFEQLLDVGWYPASMQRPRTVFTFNFLDTFHRITLQGKITLLDYYNSVVLKMNNSGVLPTIYRYHEATLCTRQWAHLMMLKRGGRAHDPTGPEGTARGALAVQCPACPQPGWNMLDGWEVAAPKDRWKHQLYVAEDACFKIKQKNKPNSAAREFGEGWSYFVGQADYAEHLAKHTVEPETVKACDSNFHAVTDANAKSKYQKYAVSGVGAVKCARHALVRPNGVADLQKGEKYHTMDYIFWATLILTGSLLMFTVSYDIACQWSVNLFARLRNGINAGSFPDSYTALVDITLRFFVPNFHIHAHGLNCITRYSFNLNKWVGLTHGETVEQEWAHIGAIATSVREMGTAARHATLDDHWGFWNWRKVATMGTALGKALKHAVTLRDKHKAAFDQMSATFPPERIKEWERAVCDWEDDHDKPDPFQELEEASTYASVRGSIAAEELKEAADGLAALHRVSASVFIQRGLRLEDDQRQLIVQIANTKRIPTKEAVASLQERRGVLYRAVMEWYTWQSVYMPCAVEQREALLPSKDTDDPPPNAEDLPLILPSSLKPQERRTCLRGCATKEASFRMAMLEDSLIDIRKYRRVLVGLVRRYKLDVFGTGTKAQTKSRAILASVASKLARAVARYRASRRALLLLQPDGDWTIRFKPLEDGDIRGPYRDEVSRPGPSAAPRTNPAADAPNRDYTPSWIWLVARLMSAGTRGQENEDDDALADEHMRGEWARQRARLKRCEEEIELLLVEMERVLRWLEARARWWERQVGLRSDADAQLSAGLKGYSQRQAKLLTALGRVFMTGWKPIFKDVRIARAWMAKWPTNEPGAAEGARQAGSAGTNESSISSSVLIPLPSQSPVAAMAPPSTSTSFLSTATASTAPGPASLSPASSTSTPLAVTTGTATSPMAAEYATLASMQTPSSNAAGPSNAASATSLARTFTAPASATASNALATALSGAPASARTFSAAAPASATASSALANPSNDALATASSGAPATASRGAQATALSAPATSVVSRPTPAMDAVNPAALAGGKEGDGEGFDDDDNEEMVEEGDWLREEAGVEWDAVDDVGIDAVDEVLDDETYSLYVDNI